MLESLPLRISPVGGDRPLSRDQKRFNTLIGRIEQSRAALQAWQNNIAHYRRQYQDVLVPLAAKLGPLLLQWARALEAAMGAGGWARGDRQVASELLAAVAAELLARDPGDARARVLFERHGGTDHEIARELPIPAMNHSAEAASAGQQPFRPATAARKSAAQQRREASAQRVGQSLREVYRKLAGALHPDREPDAAKRIAKTALMARVNEAHDRKDLLALLELQLHIEQIDAEHLAGVDATRLKHYNKVLAQQAVGLAQQVDGVEQQFRDEFGLDAAGPPLDPLKLNKVLQAQAAHQRAALAQLRQETLGFSNPGWAKRWISATRAASRHGAPSP